MDDKTYKLLLEISTNASMANEGVKRINGSIARMQEDINKNRVDIATLMSEYSENLKRVYEFQVEQKKRRDAEESFWGNLKSNWINFCVIGLTSGFVGTFIPLIWMYLKRYVLGIT